MTGCAGHGLLAVAAANAVAGGADLAGAADAVEALRERMSLLFAVETLEFLRRGGRIGSASAWIGTALKIKPILSIDSEIYPVERVRTSSRAIARLVRELRDKHDAGCDVFFVQHVQAPDVAERVAASGAEVFGRRPEVISELGPVIGTHTGPGLIGVMALPSALLGPV
jgi:DegV family protein with EDD domain